jgi:hypothetical protein
MRAKVAALSAKIEAQQVENAALKAALRSARQQKQAAKTTATPRRTQQERKAPAKPDRLVQHLWPTPPRK